MIFFFFWGLLGNIKSLVPVALCRWYQILRPPWTIPLISMNYSWSLSILLCNWPVRWGKPAPWSDRKGQCARPLLGWRIHQTCWPETSVLQSSGQWWHCSVCRPRRSCSTHHWWIQADLQSNSNFAHKSINSSSKFNLLTSDPIIPNIKDYNQSLKNYMTL